jgi:hypothetical protein
VCNLVLVDKDFTIGSVSIFQDIVQRFSLGGALRGI